MVAKVPYFIEDSDVSKKELFFVKWPETGRPISDGIHDAYHFQELRTLDAIGRNGKFMSRVDQTTLVCPTNETVIIVYLTDDKEKKTVDVPPGRKIAVPAGLDFTIMYASTSKVQVLNRQTEALGGTVVEPRTDNKLDPSFATEPISIVPASQTGAMICHARNGYHCFNEQNLPEYIVNYYFFPGSISKHSKAAVLENRFTMEWKLVDGVQQVHFEGTYGFLEGKSGEPGVFLVNDKEIHINLLLRSYDGSFYLEADGDFLMVTARCKANGDPDQKTLRIAKYHKDGVKLQFGYWHSVPIPVPGGEKLSFVEMVSNTNANSTINVLEETGHKIRALL